MPRLKKSDLAGFLAGFDDDDDEPGESAPVVVVEVEPPTVEQIEAAGEADAERIRAEGDATAVRIEAAAEAEATVIEAQAEASETVGEALAETGGPDLVPDGGLVADEAPRDHHWLTRPLIGRT